MTEGRVEGNEGRTLGLGRVTEGRVEGTEGRTLGLGRVTEGRVEGNEGRTLGLGRVTEGRVEGNEGRTLGLGRETEGRGAGREVDGRLIDGVRLKPPLGRDIEGARLPPLPPRCACAVAGTSRQQTRTDAQEQRTNNCNFIFSLYFLMSVLDLSAHYQHAHLLTRRGFVNGDVFIVMSPRTGAHLGGKR